MGGSRMRRISNWAFTVGLCLAMVAAAFQAAPMAIAYYMMDGNAIDAAGTSNGIVYGGVTTSPGPLPALSYNTPTSAAGVFDGSGNQYIEIPNVAALENIQEASYTLSAWARPYSIPPGTGAAYNAAYAVIIKPGYHEGIMYRNNQSFGFDHWATGDVYAGTGGTAGKAPNAWYHVAAVWDRTANQVRMYVNGTLEGTAAATLANREYAQNPWRIGIAYPGTGNYTWPMNGAIDDVRIYNYALTTAQIAILAAGVPPPQNLTATTPTFGQITLNWQAPTAPGTYTYTIQRRIDQIPPAAWGTIATGVNALTYVDSGVFPFTPYEYQVLASSVAVSGPSNPAVATRTEPPPRTTTIGQEKNQCNCGTVGVPGPATLAAAAAALGLLLLCLRRS